MLAKRLLLGAQLLSACVCGTRLMRTWIGEYVCGVCGGGTEVERVFSTVSADGGFENAFRGTSLFTIVLGHSTG